MNKKIVFLLITLMLFTSCSNIRRIRRSIKDRKEENAVETQPVPVFEDIETYIKASYKNVSWHDIRRREYLRESPHLDPRTQDLIMHGELQVGMYKEDVVASIGGTDNKIKKQTDFGIKEEWIYEDKILYFENGVLKNIEEIEKPAY